MSGEKFAEYLEIPYGTIRDIEAGISGGRASTKLKIAKKLKTTVEALEGPTPAQKASNEDQRSASPLSKADLIVAIVALLPALNESELRSALATIEASPSLTTSANRAVKF
jgi:transcriptional regulator with XRE-family HTH domain